MGCWNATCGISNLPIFYGDEVVMYIIERNQIAEGNGLGFSYPYEMYEPIAPPIYGRYNDYGGIEDIKNNEDTIFDHLMSIKYQIDEGMAKRDGLVNKEPRNLEEMINDYIGRGVYRDIGFMLVRQDIHGVLIYSMNNEIGDNLDFHMKEFCKAHDPSDFMSKLLLERSNGFIRATRHWNRLFPLVEKYGETTDKDLKDSFIDLIMMESVLTDLREHWHVTSGAGSQTDITNSHKVLANATTEIINFYEKRNEEDEY
ncbi:hypothetical protein ABFV99_13810 [Cytobacillus horneckiae]|uniref:hypothetical protein n=1 Tax=Cytobacillus horneckiae TaxID=549687 RepID=UPI0034CEAA5D